MVIDGVSFVRPQFYLENDMYIALNQNTRAIGRSIIHAHMKEKAGEAFEEHFYASVHAHAAKLEERGFMKSAADLRRRIVRHTAPIYDTSMREALALYAKVKTGLLSVVQP